MRRDPGDRALGLAGATAAISLMALFGWLIADVVRLGASTISWTFLTAPPADAGRAGGIGTILVSTFLVLAVCLIVALPIGIGSAAWAAEVSPRGRRAITASLDLLASVPSIVFGLFGMTFFGHVLGLGFSILSGGLTLSCMILPIVVRSTYAGFRSVPTEIRAGAVALGLGRATMVRHIFLPAAMHGVLVGVILGVGRATAETAALIFTSGYVTRMPESLFDSGRTLSVHIYDLAMNVPGGEQAAYGTALVLLSLLLIINLAAVRLSERWSVSEPLT